MAKRAAVALCLLGMLALAAAQYTADDARALGEPGNNYCKALCTELGKRNKGYAAASAQTYCKNECVKCVDAVAKTKANAKAPLPSECQTPFTRFKEVPAIISDYKAGKVSAEKGRP